MASDLRRTLLHPKRYREISGHAPVTAIIHEPQRDWAPLLRAPYFCVSDGFITSAERWKRALQTEVQRPSLFRVGPRKAVSFAAGVLSPKPKNVDVRLDRSDGNHDSYSSRPALGLRPRAL